MGENGAEKPLRTLVFRTGGTDFCLELRTVLEVGRREPLTPVPKAPPYLSGMLSYHGSPVPVMDLCLLLRLPSGAEAAENSRIIYISSGKLTAGLLVDAVSEVRMFAKESILPPPETLPAEVDLNFVDGICTVPDRGGLVLLLDAARLLAPEEKLIAGISENK